MRTTLLFIFGILIGFIHAQENWTQYKLDSNLTVEIPENYVIKDTLDKKTVEARTESANIYIVRLYVGDKNDSNTPILDQDDLIKYYKKLCKGALTELKSNDYKINIHMMDSLLAVYLDCNMTVENQNQTRYMEFIRIHNMVYAVIFAEVQGSTELNKPTREKLFNSIIFRTNLKLTDQFNFAEQHKQSNAYKAGFIAGKLFFWLLIIGLPLSVVILIVALLKRKNN